MKIVGGPRWKCWLGTSPALTGPSLVRCGGSGGSGSSTSLSAGTALEQSIGASRPRSAASLLLFLRPPGISKHTDEYGSIFNFESSTRSDQGSEFRIACCMQARSISAPWLGQLAQSGRPPLAFRMSTKSSTSVISSFSIKKLSSLEQCSQQLYDCWSCCQRSVLSPIFFSHNAAVDSWMLKLFFFSTWN